MCNVTGKEVTLYALVRVASPTTIG